MEAIILIAGIVQLFMIIAFFQMSSNISTLVRKFNEFTKYYYDLQDYKNTKDKPQTSNTIIPQYQKFNFDPEILVKPIDEKLTTDDYKMIFEKDKERFMTIANYFYKNDLEFYNQNIFPLMKDNR